MKSNAVIILQDGTVLPGRGFGASKKVTGEFVFNTGMVGYPESLTDPSYQGQILNFTYPLIGNYGVPDPNKRDKWNIPKYFETEYFSPTGSSLPDYFSLETPNMIRTTGIVVQELCKEPNHWQSAISLDEWLKKEDIPGIERIDTRELTKKIRIHGVMLGILEVCDEGDEPNIEKLLQEVKSVKDPNEKDLVKEVTIPDPITYENKDPTKIVLIDCGMKLNILRALLARNVTVIRVPYDLSAEEILEYKPDGFFISNGPGDPAKNVKTIETIRKLVEDEKIPLMGICLGNQLFALSMGGSTYKLKYGHRSQNQPCIDIETGRCYITTQNHGFSIDTGSLKTTRVKPWFINANDKTIEGIKHMDHKAFSVQFHPEHQPGPVDAEYLIDDYIQALKGGF